MKKYMIFMIVCLFFLGLTGCSGKSEEASTAVTEETVILPGGGTNNVYVITANKKDDFSKAELQAAGAVIEEAGYIVKARYHGGKEETQTKLLKGACGQKPAAIVCDYLESSQLAECLTIAKEAGIPVFLIGEETKATKDAALVIQTDRSNGEETGKEAGEQVVKYLTKE